MVCQENYMDSNGYTFAFSEYNAFSNGVAIQKINPTNQFDHVSAKKQM